MNFNVDVDILGHDGILILCPLPTPRDQTHLSPRSPGRWSLPSPRVCQFSPQCYERCHPPASWYPPHPHLSLHRPSKVWMHTYYSLAWIVFTFNSLTSISMCDLIWVQGHTKVTHSSVGQFLKLRMCSLVRSGEKLLHITECLTPQTWVFTY